jgi:glycerol-3-phosphate dehydrogenase
VLENPADSFNLSRERAQKFEKARSSDLLVIGGGVNGLAVAWSAALSGLRVTIVDKGDWGSGTSSWSSRLIHGGLKYLEKLDVFLVRESLADREWLLQSAPHLVKPMPFLLPYVKGNKFSKPLLRMGMIVYDLLSFDKSVPWHSNYNRVETIERWPGIREEGLQGGSVYYDAQVEDSERLCTEMMLAARAAGATTINYAKVSGLLVDGTEVRGARVLDEISGETCDLHAKVTVNLAGAWLDSVFEGTPMSEKRWIGGTKGTHLAIRRPDLPIETSVYFESDDARPMLVIPWKDMLLIGSTDKRFEGDLDTLSADQEEVDYILHETNKMFPAWEVSEDDIYYWYTGLRPLPYVSTTRTADITRRHEVHTHSGLASGLISVTGGKLTTFRTLSNHVMKIVGKKLGVQPVSIGTQMFPGAMGAGQVSIQRLAKPERLRRLYGGLVTNIESVANTVPGATDLVDRNSGVTRAEVINAVVTEEAVSLADVLARRTVIGLNSDLGESGIDAISREMAHLMGWSEEQREAQVESYRLYLRRFTVKAPLLSQPQSKYGT